MNSDNKQIRDVADVAARIMAGLPPIQEELKGGQTKLDVDKDGDIQADDLADLRAKKKVKKEEVEIGEESHQSKTTMKHIPNASPALKQAAKDIKPGVGGYRDRIDMLKAGGVKEEVEQIDEVKMADLPSTKVQGRAYGASKPQPSAFDILKGPKDKELKSIESEKKKKKISEMIAIYKEGGLKTFFESIKKEDWNTFHIIAKGNRLQHYINGKLMSDVTDNDTVNGKNKGKDTRSYERFKARKVGEDIYPINLELNSDLRKGYTTGTASGVNVIKFQDDLSQKKAGRHEENYKTEIFKPSLNNLEDAKEVMRKQGEAVLRGAFRK